MDAFADRAAFSDYYSALANEIRRVNLRNTRAERVDILEFHFTDPNAAEVTVHFVGPHQRFLRFWDLEVERVDQWQRLEGRWVIVPAKL